MSRSLLLRYSLCAADIDPAHPGGSRGQTGARTCSSPPRGRASPSSGTNEKLNGLLRQYFPKRANLGSYTIEDLRRAAELLNNRRRKTLGWATPAAALTAQLS